MSPSLPQSSKSGVPNSPISGVLGKCDHKHPYSGGGSTSEKLTKIPCALGCIKLDSPKVWSHPDSCVSLLQDLSHQPSEENL